MSSLRSPNFERDFVLDSKFKMCWKKVRVYLLSRSSNFRTVLFELYSSAWPDKADCFLVLHYLEWLVVVRYLFLLNVEGIP